MSPPRTCSSLEGGSGEATSLGPPLPSAVDDRTSRRKRRHFHRSSTSSTPQTEKNRVLSQPRPFCNCSLRTGGLNASRGSPSSKKVRYSAPRQDHLRRNACNSPLCPFHQTRRLSSSKCPGGFQVLETAGTIGHYSQQPVTPRPERAITRPGRSLPESCLVAGIRVLNDEPSSGT